MKICENCEWDEGVMPCPTCGIELCQGCREDHEMEHKREEEDDD